MTGEGRRDEMKKKHKQSVENTIANTSDSHVYRYFQRRNETDDGTAAGAHALLQPPYDYKRFFFHLINSSQKF